jgi:hypothetical protein
LSTPPDNGLQSMATYYEPEGWVAADIAAIREQRKRELAAFSACHLSWPVGAIGPYDQLAAQFANVSYASAWEKLMVYPRPRSLTSAMPTQTESAFWIVWSPTGHKSPSFRHQSIQAATTEAERLATAHPGQLFVVLEPVAARRVDSMIRTQYVGGNCDGIPF